MIDKWDERFMRMAIEVRGWVKGPDLGVGAIVVSPDKRQFSAGYSGLPRGMIDENYDLADPGLKDLYMMHAEQNALLNAPCSVEGWTLYCTKCMCTKCAAAMLQAGINRVVTYSPDIESRWCRQQELAVEMLKDAGKKVEMF